IVGKTPQDDGILRLPTKHLIQLTKKPPFRPHKFLERQYQLQAQKRHEEHVRQDYYRETARYFEREAAAAQKFNSWSTKSRECYSDRLEKLQRAENLKKRREKLRRLFAEENEKFEKELEEQRLTRRRSNEAITLEELRQKLMEKKAEQSLYYPNACRLRSYAFSPTYAARKLEALDNANNGPDSVRPVSGNSQRHKRFSTSPSIGRALYYDYEEDINNNEDNKSSTPTNRRYAESYRTAKMSEHDKMAEHVPRTNLRFAARSNQQSMCETNLRDDDYPRECHNITHTPQENNGQYLFPSEQEEQRQQNKSNQTNEAQQEYRDDDSSEAQEDRSVEERLDELNMDGRSNASSEYEQSLPEERREEIDEPDHAQVNAAPLHADFTAPTAFVRHTENEKTDDHNAAEDMDRHRRGNMRQKDADVAGDADISVQMYRYLKHNDLKRQIVDLCKREHTFVIKQSFDDALRLREMRNELILLKNKNLYENQDLAIDEETRKAGLEVIAAREKLNEKRTKMRNTGLYSDEAKDLWKQWVHEDEAIAKTETNAMRDLMLQELENEWQNLALSDKNRISQLYDRVMIGSDLQDEQKLAAVIRAANEGQKQYMNYLGQ
ncbi:hypothetical protein TSAR_001471, partial [Trichomalopsis sarcophagae]